MNMSYVYCDGCAINNGKSNVYGGYGVYFPLNENLNVSEYFTIGNCTNQRTEIYAMYTTLKIINSNLNKFNDNIYIYSDSLYTINCIIKWLPNWEKNNWKKTNGKDVLNKDLLLLLWNEFNSVKENKLIELKHINSHTGNTDQHSLGNNEADRLAVNGANKKLK